MVAIFSFLYPVCTGTWVNIHRLHGSDSEDAHIPAMGCAVFLHVTDSWTRQYVWNFGGSAHTFI